MAQAAFCIASSAGPRPRVHTRQNAAEDLHRHLGALHVVALVDRLAERDRIAVLQGQRDAVPVGARLVLQHRPALQARGIAVLRRQHQPVRRLPQRRRGDIADAHRAMAVARAVQRDVAQALVRLAAQQLERLADTRAQVGIGDLDAVGLLQHELAQAVGA